MNNKEIRYTIDSANRVRQWHCWFGTEDGGSRYGIFCTDGLLSGKMKDPIFTEAKEKNIGKANYISAEEQSKLMVQQKVGQKERSNYFLTPELALSSKLWLPMLCPSGMKWRDFAPTVVYPAYASPKLDGARANAMNFKASIENGQVFLQTRTGKEWLNCEHIAVELLPVLLKHPNWIIDGEFYNHSYRNNFEALMSIIKKSKPTSDQKSFSAETTQYHIYDIYNHEEPSADVITRQQYIHEMFQEFSLHMCVPVYSVLCSNEEAYNDFHAKCLDLGYEGSILRLNAAYKVDSRATCLLKRKESFDFEAKILDVIEGEGTNKGIASKIIIDLTSATGMNKSHVELLKADNQDAGMAKGWDHARCKDLLDKKSLVIGEYATIEYFEISGHGVCRFPKMKVIRNYE